MKSVNLDILAAVSVLFHEGEITMDQLNQAIQNPPKHGLRTPCGKLADFHGHFFTLFIATDKEDRNKVTRSKDGVRIKFNFRADDVKKKTQEAQTPGQVLPQGVQGAPALTPEILAALQALGLLPQAAQAAPEVSEASFAEVSNTLKL